MKITDGRRQEKKTKFSTENYGEVALSPPLQLRGSHQSDDVITIHPLDKFSGKLDVQACLPQTITSNVRKPIMEHFRKLSFPQSSSNSIPPRVATLVACGRGMFWRRRSGLAYRIVPGDRTFCCTQKCIKPEKRRRGPVPMKTCRCSRPHQLDFSRILCKFATGNGKKS